MIPRNVLEAFQLDGDAIKLPGGQGTSVKVGNAVLKPVEDDPAYVDWVSSVLDDLQPKGYRLATPMRTKEGSSVYQGWSCARFEEGQPMEGNVEGKLKVARLFHKDLAGSPYRSAPTVENPWSRGHRIAWCQEEIPIETNATAKEVLHQLLTSITRHPDYETQLIHGDLAGNILFHQTLPPVVIDFSPTIAPAAYGESILLCDCIAWQGSSLQAMHLLPENNHSKEMITRALIFRLAVAAIFANGDDRSFAAELKAYEPIVKTLVRA
ncbi:hypothetical protein [Aureibacillus halotolerans]|uniref:Uncharacterized protein (TIGR02569 family) n=1 Tax=Aureibacillus halotolerans TaxID=1508390 RepID=A0A4V3D5M5_9BACI|nr:hypothetical protein [Aureibacillus halotolerans]TDQ40677.1 uncharacterized protein (TIGR02569 family) [Aureibacillus halotolerans]